ncbi:trihelix transcription factor ASR3-like [Tasmannia lanceolata]|uniref:trihelix transcription factor ASR3-like n=1 Tax=Tasmannia lanceolata TaxID=3420 RepID=UPI0040629044
MALESITSNGVPQSVAEDINRPPRLPRWTRQEILVLIQGKKVAENRVRRGRAEFGSLTQMEPKWASVSSYCKRHGVNRGPVQCRKRWSNLAGDFKKIKECELKVNEEGESFWVMRNDVRRERKLPGFFDREVYEIMDGVGAEGKGEEVVVEEEEVIFDSGRPAGADEGLFSDFEQSGHDEIEGSPEKEEVVVVESPERMAVPTPVAGVGAVEAPVPISVRQYQPFDEEYVDPGMANEKPPTANTEKGSTSQEGQKRRRVSAEEGGVTNLQGQLIEVLERNSRTLTTQLEVQNVNWQLDRDQRKGHAESLVGVLSKLADSLGRIADKL